MLLILKVRGKEFRVLYLLCIMPIFAAWNFFSYIFYCSRPVCQTFHHSQSLICLHFKLWGGCCTLCIQGVMGALPMITMEKSGELFMSIRAVADTDVAAVAITAAVAFCANALASMQSVFDNLHLIDIIAKTST